MKKLIITGLFGLSILALSCNIAIPTNTQGSSLGSAMAKREIICSYADGTVRTMSGCEVKDPTLISIANDIRRQLIAEIGTTDSFAIELNSETAMNQRVVHMHNYTCVNKHALFFHGVVYQGAYYTCWAYAWDYQCTICGARTSFTTHSVSH